jgi:hypothetical protein
VSGAFSARLPVGYGGQDDGPIGHVDQRRRWGASLLDERLKVARAARVSPRGFHRHIASSVRAQTCLRAWLHVPATGSVNRRVYRGVPGRTQRKSGTDRVPLSARASLGDAVSSTWRRARKSCSAARASSIEQFRVRWIARIPSACKPCSVSIAPRFTSASQTSCSCWGDIQPRV